jgi:2,3-bisphosphoglycerate-dependent phosphoglycerate mutase
MRKGFLGLILAVFIGCFSIVNAQTTIILTRHAEKEAASGTMSATDPELSAAGKDRAEKLVTVLSAYKPDLFYSTDFIRTKKTITPLATKFSKEITVYDPRKLQEFADELKKIEGKTIIVAGHSNTTPALANFLIGSTKYAALDDSVYNKLWIITVKDRKIVEEKMIEY